MKIESMTGKMVLIACATLCTGASAWAEDMVVTATRTVKYSAAESATPAGAVRLYDALRAAASRVCRESGMPSLASLEANDMCRSSALSRAVADVNIDAVTALHLHDSGYRTKQGTVTIARR